MTSAVPIRSARRRAIVSATLGAAAIVVVLVLPRPSNSTDPVAQPWNSLGQRSEVGQRPTELRPAPTTPPSPGSDLVVSTDSGDGTNGSCDIVVRLRATDGGAIDRYSAYAAAGRTLLAEAPGSVSEPANLRIEHGIPGDGVISIGAWTPGYRRRVIESWAAAGEHLVRVLDVERGETLSGVVEDDAGIPVAGLALLITSRSDASLFVARESIRDTHALLTGPDSEYSEARAVTDTRGRFSVTGVSDAPHIVVSLSPEWFIRMPTRDGRRPSAQTLPPVLVRPPAEGVRLTASQTYRFEVTAVDPDSEEPILAFSASLLLRRPEGDPIDLGVGGTSSTGSIRTSFPRSLPQLPDSVAADAVLVVRAVGRRTETEIVRFSPSSPVLSRRVKLASIPAGRVRFNVHDPSGRRMRLPLGVTLRQVPDDGAGPVHRELEFIESDGLYELAENPGTYELELGIRPPTGVTMKPWATRIGIVAEAVTTVDVELPEWARLVLRRPRAAPRVVVELRKASLVFATGVDGGERSIDGLEPGTWTYRLLDSSTGAEREAGVLTLRSDAQTELVTSR